MPATRELLVPIHTFAPCAPDLASAFGGKTPIAQLVQEADRALTEIHQLQLATPYPQSQRPPLEPWRWRGFSIVGIGTGGALIFGAIDSLLFGPAAFTISCAAIGIAACTAVLFQPMRRGRTALIWTVYLGNLVGSFTHPGLALVAFWAMIGATVFLCQDRSTE
jgi:hypothetical protein